MTNIKPHVLRLNSFKGNKKGKSYRYKYFCKSRSFKANFTECEFSHVNFRGSIMTYCCFKRSKFEGVEFLGTNLRNSNFESAYFKDVVFVGALLDNCKFKSAQFNNVLFVNTNISYCKNLETDCNGITFCSQYPKVNISSNLKDVLEELKENNYITKFKVLHLSTKKYNHLNIKLLLDEFSEEKLIKGLRKAKDKINRDICTLSCLTKFLQSHLKM